MATDEISSVHVPAWKKLGLKLKFAKEEVPTQREADSGLPGKAQDGMKVDGEVKEGRDKKKSKKRRLDEDGEDGGSDAVAGDDGSEKKKNKKSKKQREEKKVSFSAETKVHDGDDEESGVEEEEEEDKEIGGDGEAAPVDEKEKEEKRKRMKEKKEKKKQGQQRQKEPTDASDTPILTYLHLYHQDRPAWKFQKNRETQLFKHVLTLERVPTAYNAALLAYLQGLKSEASRQRLGQSAEEIVKSEMEEQAAAEENVDEEADGQNAPAMADYYKTVEAFRIRLSQGKDELNDIDALGEGQVTGGLRKKLEKRLRAEVMWFAINSKLFYIQKPKGSQKAKSGAPQQNGGQAQSAGKKKKNRTVIVDISSSSESDSDDDNKTPQKTKPVKQQTSAKNKKKSRTAVEDSSSSSDSDDSSESESDSDDGKKKKVIKHDEKESSDSSSVSSSDSD